MFDRGWDLVALMRQRRYRLLLNVVEGLPRHSNYGEALAMDEELAAVASGQPKPSVRPSMREWSPEVEVLASIYNRMLDFVQSQAEKNLRLKPWPVPMTASEIVRARERKRTLARLQGLIEQGQARYRELHPGEGE